MLVSNTIRVASLAGLGTSDYVANNQWPGQYVAMIAPGGSHWFGRSGSLRTGAPGNAIIGLTKKD